MRRSRRSQRTDTRASTSPQPTRLTGMTAMETASTPNPMATSTTSQWSMPGKAKKPARDRTPSGVIAGTRTTTTRQAHRPASSVDISCRVPTSGSATTQSSRRTAAWASSLTNSATTSDCRTCTTPLAPVTTAPVSGRLMSSGSWASDSPNAIGDKPVHMGAWEKLALGWLGDNLGTPRSGRTWPSTLARRKPPRAIACRRYA